MKTRTGFISNSSSTSFIVGVEDETRVELRISVDLTMIHIGNMMMRKIGKRNMNNALLSSMRGRS